MCSESKLSMILRQVSEIYRQVYGDDLVKVILYGSYARGDFEKDSDIDIVALVHGNRQELQDKLKRQVSLIKNIPNISARHFKLEIIPIMRISLLFHREMQLISTKRQRSFMRQ